MTVKGSYLIEQTAKRLIYDGVVNSRREFIRKFSNNSVNDNFISQLVYSGQNPSEKLLDTLIASLKEHNISDEIIEPLENYRLQRI